MFKRFKKGVLAGTLFTAALNLNACAYGTPTDSSSQSSEVNTANSSQVQDSELSSQETTTTAAATTTTAKTEDSSFDPDDNQNVDVYGPPEDFEPDDPDSSSQGDDSSSDYEPDDNMNECVYGPPEWFDDSSQETTTTTTAKPKKTTTTTTAEKKKKKTTTTTAAATTTTTAKPAEDSDYDPEDNMNVCVYGPPEWFDGSSEDK